MTRELHKTEQSKTSIQTGGKKNSVCDLNFCASFAVMLIVRHKKCRSDI